MGPLVIAIAAAACSGAHGSEPADASAGDLPGTVDVGATDDAATDGAPGPISPELIAVQAIFTQRCVFCHSAEAGHGPLQTFPALPLTPDRSYSALVAKPATETCGGTLVVAGDPDASYLVRKLTEDTPCDGLRMPRPGEAMAFQPLPAGDIQTIRNWISAGAPR